MYNIKTVRTMRNLKQCELAKAAKVSIPMLSRYENGWSLPKVETKLRIARALCISVYDIAWENEPEFTD